jgi:hypothetical protein
MGASKQMPTNTRARFERRAPLAQAGSIEVAAHSFTHGVVPASWTARAWLTRTTIWSKRWVHLCALMLMLTVVSAGACSAGPRSPAPPDATTMLEIPLTVHVATHQGEPVVNDVQVIASIRRANRAMAPYNMRVTVARTRTMSPGHTSITGESDRLELARRAAQDGTLHVFFVSRVRMYEHDDADARLSGLHWRYAGMRSQMHRREFLVVAQDAPNTTLAHEVGHALGLEHHTSIENIMCSCRRGPDTLFTTRQGETMRVGATEFLRAAR